MTHVSDVDPGWEALFRAERPRLVALAYRVTGSVADAEDAVQEAWIRWQRTDRAAVERPAAWLTTVTSRIALDRLKSAQRVREAYVGPWLPDAVAEEPGPAEQAELAESLTLGFLAVLERLGPVERVVFLLADVFGVPFDEIAPVVDRSPEACRQVASRARRRVREDRPRFEPTDEDAWQVTLAFLAAARLGDTDGLLALLAPDAVAVSDGGAEHHAARRPVVGADRVARFVTGIAKRPVDDLVPELTLLNGQPGLVYRDPAGRATFAMAAEVEHGRIKHLWTILNPAKLRALDRT